MGIRDYILMAILFATIPLSVWQPFFGLLAFSWFAYMRPNDMTWGVNQFRPSLLIAVATIAGVIFSRRERFFVWEWRTVLLGLFLAVIGTSALLAPDWSYSLSAGKLEDLAKILFIAVLTTGLVNTRERVRWLLLVIAMSLGMLALKSAVQGVLHPGNVLHGPGGAIEDNNDYGLALVMTAPLLAYLARDEKGPLLRATLVLMAAACVAGVLFTRSRGGALALGLVGVVWLFKSRRNAWALILSPLAVAMVLVLSPPQLWLRLRALISDGGTSDASAMGRRIAWEKGLNMWADNKLFGVGPGYFTDVNVWNSVDPPLLVDKPLVAHNTYVQLLAESGAVALAVFLSLLIGTLVYLARTKHDPAAPWRRRYADALFLSLLGFTAGSFFLSRTHFDLTYHLIGLSVSLRIASQGGESVWATLRRGFDRVRGVRSSEVRGA